MNSSQNPIHPLKSKAKILLSSVFGPFSRDDDSGSRRLNPMELYHNQVTRVQGVFSFRMFNRTFGLKMIQENISAPCTILDYPTLERFIEEIKNNKYDIVGIGSLIHNGRKVKIMCDLVRKYLPEAVIVIGGHITGNESFLKKYIDADYVVKGEGIKWFRHFLGEDEDAPIKHPFVYSGFNGRILGVDIPNNFKGAMLVPSAGCPVGCDFCCSSSLFGGKGKSVLFYKTGDELFSVMCSIEKRLRSKNFYIFDENFLLYKERALRLLELMEKNDKDWSLLVFSSPDAVNSYSIEELLGLGICAIWMGLEGKIYPSSKLDLDTHALVASLQSNGIRVIASSIIGLENHTPNNIKDCIDWCISHNTDFHQFALLISIPGTPLYYKHKQAGKIFEQDEYSVSDLHGQKHTNYKHDYMSDEQLHEFLMKAFDDDFRINGPSITRCIATMLSGWKKHKDNPNKRIRSRYKREFKDMLVLFSAITWATRKWYEKDAGMFDKMDLLFKDLLAQGDLKIKIIAPLLGGVIYRAMRREEKRLAAGLAYEPPMFYEKNEAASKIRN